MKQSKPRANPYHAVSVEAPIGACAAATAVRDQRYLSTEAPSLPLAGCSDPARCKCRYKHWDDRRQEDDRRSPIQGIGAQYHAENDRRRNQQDRRRNR